MIKLVIFDVDGVILDSERLYLESAIINSRENGYNIPKEILMSVIGTGMENHRQTILDYMGSDFDFDSYFRKIEEYWYSLRTNEAFPPKKGFFELLAYLKQKGISIALATSTEKERQIKNLEAAGIPDCFDFMVFGDEISRHKPDPEIYEMVLDHFGYPKDEVLIIEDSINGIKSGLNAGAKVIYIPDVVKVPDELARKAYRKLDDLSEVIDVIEELNRV